jgi:hypothetical protein
MAYIRGAGRDRRLAGRAHRLSLATPASAAFGEQTWQCQGGKGGDTRRHLCQPGGIAVGCHRPWTIADSADGLRSTLSRGRRSEFVWWISHPNGQPPAASDFRKARAHGDGWSSDWPSGGVCVRGGGGSVGPDMECHGRDLHGAFPRTGFGTVVDEEWLLARVRCRVSGLLARVGIAVVLGSRPLPLSEQWSRRRRWMLPRRDLTPDGDLNGRELLNSRGRSPSGC